MALFFADDQSYDLSRRMTGFYRYRQLLSFYGLHWILINIITTIGMIPLFLGITYSILVSSILVLIPLSLIGGMIFGPFISGLFDALLRGLRDAPGKWWQNYKKSWKHNFKDSLIPGAIFGLIIGMNAFMLYMIYIAKTFPSLGTVVLYLFALLLLIIVFNLYFAQLVLFKQSFKQTMINMILFTSMYLWKVFFSAFLEMCYIIVFVLLAPWTLLILPFIGIWFITFLFLFRIYDAFNGSLEIEKQYIEIEGDPWKEDTWDKDDED